MGRQLKCAQCGEFVMPTVSGDCPICGAHVGIVERSPIPRQEPVYDDPYADEETPFAGLVLLGVVVLVATLVGAHLTDNFESVVSRVAIAGLIGTYLAKFWLAFRIVRTSLFAAAICVLVPYATLFFAQANWDIAKRPVTLWVVSQLCLATGFLLSANGW